MRHCLVHTVACDAVAPPALACTTATPLLNITCMHEILWVCIIMHHQFFLSLLVVNHTHTHYLWFDNVFSFALKVESIFLARGLASISKHGLSAEGSLGHLPTFLLLPRLLLLLLLLLMTTYSIHTVWLLFACTIVDFSLFLPCDDEVSLLCCVVKGWVVGGNEGRHAWYVCM